MIAILFIVALVAVVWGGILLVRGQLLLACIFFLIATCCFGHEFFNADVGPIPFTIDRLIAGLVIAAYLVQRRLGRSDPKPLISSDWWAIAFFGVLVVSTLSVDFRGGDQPGMIPPIMRLLIGYLIPLAMYWVGRQARLTESKVNAAYTALIAFGVYLAATALLEVAQAWALVFPKYISDPTVGLHFGRARGPMVQSVSLGLYLSVCALCAWTWWPRMGRYAQLATIILTPMFLLAAFLTYTRSVWLGLGLGIIIMLALLLKGRVRTALLAGIIVGASLLTVAKLDSIIGFQRDEYSVADTRKSVTMRGSFTYVSWKMFLDRPIFGFGFGQFYREKLPYLSDQDTDLQLQEIRGFIHHNTVLSILTELGMVGLLLFLGMLGSWVHSAWRIWRDCASPAFARTHAILFLAALSAYTCPLIFHELSYASADNALIFLLAGITVGLRADAQRAAVNKSVPAAQPELQALVLA